MKELLEKWFNKPCGLCGQIKPKGKIDFIFEACPECVELVKVACQSNNKVEADVASTLIRLSKNREIDSIDFIEARTIIICNHESKLANAEKKKIKELKEYLKVSKGE